MTAEKMAVIIARTFTDAAEAAHNLGISYWIMPKSPHELRGYMVPIVVYVEGWRESEIITTDTLDALQSRLTGDHLEIQQLLTSSFLTGERRAEHASSCSISPGWIGADPRRLSSPPRRG